MKKEKNEIPNLLVDEARQPQTGVIPTHISSGN